MSAVSIVIPAPPVNFRMIGSSEYVASAGASSISVQMILLGRSGHSVASLWRCAWHSIVTATGNDVMWHGNEITWMPRDVVSPP